MKIFYKNTIHNKKNIEINENLFLGIGFFETIKFINKNILFFDQHINRMLNNQFLPNEHSISKNDILKNCNLIIKENNLIDGLLKIVLLPKKEISGDWEYYIYPRSLPTIKEQSVKIIFLSEQNYPLLRFKPMYKSLSYMGNMLGLNEAKQNLAFEPIFYNQSKYITEGAMRNICFIKNKTLITPSLELGILDGITKKIVMKLALKLNLNIKESKILLSDVNSMDEAFLVSTGIGVVPCFWDKWSSNFLNTNKLKNLYNETIKNH